MRITGNDLGAHTSLPTTAYAGGAPKSSVVAMHVTTFTLRARNDLSRRMRAPANNSLTLRLRPTVYAGADAVLVLA